MDIQFCSRARAAWKEREAQGYLASSARFRLYPLRLSTGVRGRSGKLITTAEASGLITDALRVQAMMVS